MNWFRRKTQPPVPPAVVQATVDPLESTRDLAGSMNAHRDAQVQAAQAHEAVSRLKESRIRNGFAPVIEESIIRRYLGSAS